jgi:hypothetical protein
MRALRGGPPHDSAGEIFGPRWRLIWQRIGDLTQNCATQQLDLKMSQVSPIR